MRYPTSKQLKQLGEYVNNQIPDQVALDSILEKVCKIDG
jgi:hypothetical protein